MKKSIVLSVLLLLFSISLFAATPAKYLEKGNMNTAVSINGLHSTIGVSVSVETRLTQKPFIKITDKMGYPLYTENISTRPGFVRSYNLSQLEIGDYTITISVGKDEVKKQIHIYEENGVKTSFIIQ